MLNKYQKIQKKMLIAKIYKNTKRYEIPKFKNNIQTQKDTKLPKDMKYQKIQKYHKI